jgi:multidrug resistance efflux pump
MEPTDTSANGGGPASLRDRVRSLQLGGRQEQRPSRARWLPWIVSLVCLLTTAAFGYRAYRVGGVTPEALAAAAGRKDAAPDAPGGGAAVAKVGAVVLQAKGYVTPISLVQVSPKVGGQLVWINERFCEGQKFRKGEKLAVLEDVDYKAEYDQALYGYKASSERFREIERTQPEEVRMAEAELEEARKLTTQLKLDMERNKRLTVGNAMAQRDMELARFSYEANAAKVDRLQSSLRMVRDARREARRLAAKYDMQQAKGVLDKAEWRLKNTVVVAPVSGTILTKKAELGNVVNPSAFSSGISASLCEMANLRQLEIDLSIQERDIAAVTEGQSCVVMPEAYQNDQRFLRLHPTGYLGKVSRLMPTADRAKGAIPVRVLILEIPESEEGKYLRPDMGALVSFLRPEAKAETAAK